MIRESLANCQSSPTHPRNARILKSGEKVQIKVAEDGKLISVEKGEEDEDND
jgi:hypothetical protein